MQINLILKDKQLRFADEPTEWMITDNDDYILHIDIQDERQLAMFAVFTRGGEAVKCTIDEDGYVLTDGERKVPMWAMAFNKMTVGVIASGYASIPFEINVRGSIKRRYDEEIVQPDDPLLEQILRIVNHVTAPEVEVASDTDDEYKIRFTTKDESIVTPNLKGSKGEKGDKGDAFTFADFTPQQLESLRGEKGDKGDPFEYSDFTPAQIEALKVKGDKGDKGDPFQYSDFTQAQLESLRGDQGVQGETGKPFTVAKTYASVSEMNLDFDNPNLDEGDFVMIASNVEDADNAKLYVKSENAFTFITDLSGSQGIQGERGIQGIQGERGLQGVGVSSAAVNASGHLIVTYTDETIDDAGVVRGADGVGFVSAAVNANGHLILTKSDTTTIDVGVVVGSDGVGIVSASIGANGHLVFTKTDGNTVDVGNVVGADGDDGNGIKDIAYDSATGNLTITLDDDTVAGTFMIKGGKGDTGLTGETGATGNGISGATFANGYLTLQFTDGTSSNAFYVKGETGRTGDTGQTGETGNGIDSTTYADGYLTIHYTDGTDSEAFYVKGGKGDKGDTGLTGQTGETGVGVSTATIDANGHLILTLTNGNTVDAGVAKGGKGDTGSTGATGNGIASATNNNGYVTFVYTDGTSSSPMYLKGDTGATGAPGADYVLTNTDKSDIAALTLDLLTAAEGVSY